VKLTRPRLAGVMLVGALALAACGSDSNTSSSSGSTSGSTTATSSTGASPSASMACAKGTLNGEGSTAQKNAVDQVVSSFQTACAGATINYNATGSGAGIKQFNAGQVDWAGSDAALNTTAVGGAASEADQAAKRCGAPAWNLPLAAGPIAIAYNLPGVNGLTLTPEVTAKIFLGQIKTWNDPAIAAINSGATLPSTPIKVFYRSDDSGTTQNLTTYLNTTVPTVWTAAPAKTWPAKAGEGREKSAGVAEGVKSTQGGIGYMEWSYAKDNQLGIAKIDNGGGAVELTGDSAASAVAAAQKVGQGNDLRLKLDYAVKDGKSYPIVLVTYEIVCSQGLTADKTSLLKAFLTYYASSAAQTSLQDIGYAPLPASLQTDVATAVAAIS